MKIIQGLHINGTQGNFCEAEISIKVQIDKILIQVFLLWFEYEESSCLLINITQGHTRWEMLFRWEFSEAFSQLFCWHNSCYKSRQKPRQKLTKKHDRDSHQLSCNKSCSSPTFINIILAQYIESIKWFKFVKAGFNCADLSTRLTVAMFLYHLTLQRASSIYTCIHGNFAGTKQQEVVVSRGLFNAHKTPISIRISSCIGIIDKPWLFQCLRVSMHYIY